MNIKSMKAILLTFIFLIASTLLLATETKLIVRAKAKDAKFIGSSIGGAYVIIKNQMTGEILAQGRTEGSTGNTDLIMREPWERYNDISDEETAKFLATLDIEEPVFVVIDVYSPINKKQAEVNASTGLWLIPGKHILGDGIVLEIPGFIIEGLKPRTHQVISLEDIKGEPFKLQANIVMMCGCPISEGGLWDANNIGVNAMIKRNGAMIGEVPLTVLGRNLFEGSMNIEEAGQYEVTIYAYQEATGNTGVDKINFIVKE